MANRLAKLLAAGYFTLKYRIASAGGSSGRGWKSVAPARLAGHRPARWGVSQRSLTNRHWRSIDVNCLQRDSLAYGLCSGCSVSLSLEFGVAKTSDIHPSDLLGFGDRKSV